MNILASLRKALPIIIPILISYCNIIYGEEFAPSTQSAVKISQISTENISKHLKHLASEETGGRLMGSAGSQKAGEYIEGVFSEYGLVPVQKYSGYSQPFEINVRHLGDENYFSIGPHTFEPKRDFIPLHFSWEGEVSGITFFANHGLNAEDYKGCRDKIAVVLDNTANTNEKRNELIIKKIELAQERGTKGLIIATSSDDTIYNDFTIFPEFIPPAYLKRWQSQHPSMSDTLLEIKTTSVIAKLKIPPVKIPVLMFAWENPIAGLTANIKVKFKDRTITGRNIIGLIKGESDEVVIIGAHYDHLGKDGEGNIFYGADDNGSGVAALLEIASAFSKIKDKINRSILFIAFDGEEWGLQGAKEYVENNLPSPPFSKGGREGFSGKTIAMFNMDTIGRNKAEEIYIIGSLRSPDLKSLNDKMNEEIGLKLLDTIEFAFDYGSDHYPFYEKGIPSIDYTSSYHEDFHKITDTVEKVNIDKVSKVAELVFRAAYEIANTNIKFDKPKKVYVPFPKK